MLREKYLQVKQEGINLQNIQTTSWSSISKKKQTIQSKNGGRPKQTFLQRKYTDGQQIHEKMLNTAHY